MQAVKFACFLVLSLAAVTRADDEIKEDEGVLVLTKDTFDKALEQYRFVLAEFCKHIIRSLSTI